MFDRKVTSSMFRDQVVAVVERRSMRHCARLTLDRRATSTMSVPRKKSTATMLAVGHQRSRYQRVTLALVSCESLRRPAHGRKMTSSVDGVSSAMAAHR